MPPSEFRRPGLRYRSQGLALLLAEGRDLGWNVVDVRSSRGRDCLRRLSLDTVWHG